MFSAVHPTTDIAKTLRHVRFVPIPEVVAARRTLRRGGSPHDMSGCVTKRGRGKALLEGDCQGAHPRRCIATRWQDPPNAQFVGDGVCKLDPFQPPKIELIPDIPVSHEREPRSADAIVLGSLP